ncbi:hypothetical protein SBRCBS47491_003667 [Sporothrix bragantina]|uniref:Protein kinase domain-containing protein n=1 Tax=Sporothrix bragantina TaxID=671064 RepID=A0ABP0BH54_9PEZI
MPRRRRQNAKPKFKFKMPFLDRGRPGSPFVSDSRWWIQQHEPLPPFGNGYKTKHRRGEEVLAQMRTEQLPQSIYCLANQPPGPEPPSDAPRIEIELGEALRPLLTQGSHIVACRVVNGTVPPVCSLETCTPFPLPASSTPKSPPTSISPLPTPSPIIVAKIFDPLYYYHNGDFDIVELADMEYCRETAAYRHLLREGVDGKLLPAYYGSYSLEVPLTEDQIYFLGQYMGTDYALLQVPKPVRRVRLILMERVEGQSMTSQLVYGDVNGLSDEARLDVIASTFEAYAQLYFHGIAHGDLAPRNVFLKDLCLQDKENSEDGTHTEDEHTERRIQEQQQISGQPVPRHRKLRFHRFVDLGLAYVLGLTDSAFPRQSVDEMRPRNPIRLFWHVFDSGAVNMYYWLPPKMRCTDIFQRWMLQRWYGDTRFESVGAVPIPVKNDQAWDRGEAITNETWPDVRGDVIGVAGAGDAKEDAQKDEVRGLVDDGKRRSDGWQLPNALSRAMAAIPGIKAMHIGGHKRKDSDALASKTAARPAVPRAVSTRSTATQTDDPEAVGSTATPSRDVDDPPKGFW